MKYSAAVRNLAFAFVACIACATGAAADDNLVNIASSASSMIVSTPGTDVWNSSLVDTSAITNGWGGAGNYGAWESPGDGWRIWTNADVDLTIGVSFTWASSHKVSKIFIATYDDKDTTRPTLRNGPDGNEIVETVYADNSNNHYKCSGGQGHLFSFSPAVTLSQLYIEVGKDRSKRFQGFYEIEVWAADEGGGTVEPTQDDPVVPPPEEPGVVALRNIAVATAVGVAPTLPAKVVGLAADGTAVGEFAVVWNTAVAPSEEGVTVVGGTAEVNGEAMNVTASVRAANAASGGGGELVNVSPEATPTTTAQMKTNVGSLVRETVPDKNNHEFITTWNGGFLTNTLTWSSAVSLAKIRVHYWGNNNYKAPTSFAFRADASLIPESAYSMGEVESDVGLRWVDFTFASPISVTSLECVFGAMSGWIDIQRVWAYESSGGGGTVESLTTATLTALAVDGVAISGFAPGIIEYTVDNGTAITSAANAEGNVGITILPALDGTARVVTLAEDGITTATYSVTFTGGGDDPGGEIVRTGMCVDLSLTGYTGAVIRDFPLLVRVDGTRLDLSAVSRDEISFSDLRNEENYPFDIDTWNPSGETLVWVRIPYLAPDFRLRLHFGGEQPANDAGAVWTDYEGVWHLGAAVDSAKGRLTEFGSSARATTGPIGAAWGNTAHGDAGGSAVAAFRSAFPAEVTNTAFTVSGWLRLNDATTIWKSLVSSHQSNGNAWSVRFPVDDANSIWLETGKAELDRGVYRRNEMFELGVWTKFDVVYDGPRVSFYLNGEPKEAFVVANPARRESWIQYLYWGGCGSTVWEANEVLGADFDECRVLASAADDARIAAEHWNQSDAESVTFAAPCEEKDAVIPDKPYVPPSARKSGFTITIRGPTSQPQFDLGDWRVQILDPRHVVIQYNGESDYLSDYEDSGELHTEKLTAGYEMVNGAEFTVNGDGVTKVGRAITAQGQISVRDLSGRNRIMGSRQFRPVHHIFVELGHDLEEGVANTLVLPDGKTLSFALTASTVSPLFKVNQCGYAASAGEKYVYLGGWLGTGGAFPLADSYPFEVVDEKTKGVVLSGVFTKRKDDAVAWEPSLSENVPLAGEKTLEGDLSALTTPGRYFVCVAGLGRSRTFRVADEAVADQFALHMLGLYQQRCGCAKEEPYTHWTDKACHLTVYRGVEPANDDEYAKRITSTPNGASAGLNHFGINYCNADVCTEKLSLPGGWHDAADYDRRPYHLQIVFELSNTYLMRPDNFFDGQLAMPERANGIPDILDEADWGLKHLVAAQQADGGVGTWIETITHPTYDDRKMPSDDTDLWRYYLARATHRSTLRYCAAAANLARALKAAGTPAALERAAVYTASAVKAWKFVTESPRQVNVPMKGSNGETVYYTEPEWLDPFEYVKAVVNLGAITGEASYFTNLNNTVTYNPGGADHYNYNGGAQWTYPLKDFFKRGEKIEWEVLDCVLSEDESLGRSGFILDELGLPLAVPESAREAYEAIKAGWTACVWRRANEAINQMENVYAYRMPYWAPDYRAFFRGKLDWGQSCPLRRALWLCSAHFLTGEQKYLDAAYLACDFHTGCNPTGMTGTSGLGEVYPVAFLSLQSFADEIGEYIPGITPYHWSAGWERLFEPANQYGPHDGGYSDYVLETFAKPWWRRWEVAENMTISVSEYTVTETIGPCAAATGYLISSERATANLKWRKPAKKLTDLPGFWCLP